MSQAARILSRLRQSSLTAAEAQAELGVGRLAARIEQLRDRGHDIHTETVVTSNRFGDECRYGRYHLIREASELNRPRKTRA